MCGEKKHRVTEDTERIMSTRAKSKEECWEFVTAFGKTNIPRILIVDDSLPLRVQMNIGLSNAGYEVIEAVNGEDALEKIDVHQPDCLVLDLLMPIMDGLEVLARMKKDGIHIPVIVLTADVQDTTKNRCIAYGVAGFINKPLEKIDILVDLIESSLNKKIKISA